MNKPLAQFAGQYREWKPAVALRDHLACVWANDFSGSPRTAYNVVPDGCVDILWTGQKLCVAGPDTRPFLEHSRPGGRVIGLRFHPGAAYRWLGLPLSEILNSRVPLAEFWGRHADSLADHLFAASGAAATARVLQTALQDRLAGVEPADPAIAFLCGSAATVRKESEPATINQLSCYMGMSERTLRRRCIDAFGYGFKTLQRILRLQGLFRLAAQAPSSELAALAMEAGFADQAHMSREVRRLCDTTPAELVAMLPR